MLDKISTLLSLKWNVIFVDAECDTITKQQEVLR